MDYQMSKTQAFLLAASLIAFGIFITSNAKSQETKYDLKSSAECKPGISKNSDGSTAYAMPYPTFSSGPKNERGEPTVNIDWKGLVLFKQIGKDGKSKDLICDKKS